MGPDAAPDVNSGSPLEKVSVRFRRADGSIATSHVTRGQLMRLAMGKQLSETISWLVKEHHHTERGDRVDLAMNPQFAQVYADPSPDIRVMSSSQVGKSLYGTLRMFAGAIIGLQMGMVFPKEDLRNQFVADKIDRTIENTPFYREQMVLAHGKNSTKLKHIGEHGGSMVFVGCNSDTELIQFTADGMDIDERDACNRDNLSLYPSRMNFSPYRLTYECSTPTLPGDPDNINSVTDNIDTQLRLGDHHQRMTYCGECGHAQCMDWYKNFVFVRFDDSGRIVDYDVRDKKWTGRSEMNPICIKCGHSMDRVLHGEWIASNPGAPLRTYHINRLVSPIGPSIDDLFGVFQKALNNPIKMQRFHNMDLGQTYAGGALSFDERLFRICEKVMQPYEMFSSHIGPCTAGIDVNVPYFDIHVSAWPSSDVDQQKVFVGKVQGEEQLHTILKAMRVSHAFIEQAPELRVAMRIQETAAEYGCTVVRCKYSTRDQQTPVIISENGDNPRIDPPRLVTLDRTATIDELYESMVVGLVAYFRTWADVLGGKMLKEFKRPVRAVEVKADTGEQRYVWRGKPDDQLHAANFDRQCGVFFGRNVNSSLEGMGQMRIDLSHGGNSGMSTDSLTRQLQADGKGKAIKVDKPVAVTDPGSYDLGGIGILRG